MSDLSVLIVDDDPGAGDAFEYMLRREGYTVRVASDATAALTEVDRELPAAIVLDLHLRTSDGVTVLRQLRATPANAGIPVAIVTGDYLVDERIIREIEELGVRLYFKPLWEEDILRIVRHLLPST
jgi:two-component system OmpR family response regulator